MPLGNRQLTHDIGHSMQNVGMSCSHYFIFDELREKHGTSSKIRSETGQDDCN